MRKIGVWVVVGMIMLMGARGAEAAKARNWGAVKVTTQSSGGSPRIGAKLTKWKQYVYLTFSNLGKVESVDYELTYTGSGIDQGVWGSIKVSSAAVSRELFMGTCSRNVCVAHKNISGVRLAITYKMKDGSSLGKRYKIKY